MTIDFLKPLKFKFKRNLLEASDFPRGPVTVTLRDGCFFCWYNAFWIHYGESLYVYTEHYGCHIFDDDILLLCGGPDKPNPSKKKKK